MAKKQKKVDKKLARQDVDPVAFLERILCNYPGWSEKELSALQALKYRVLAAVYDFYGVVPRKKGKIAIDDFIDELKKQTN